MAWPAIAAAAGAVLGGIAGGQKDSTRQYSEGSQNSGLNLLNFKDLNKGRSGLEKQAYNNQLNTFSDLSSLLNIGPGQNEIQANNQFQNSFASQLEQLLGQIQNPNSQANFNEAKQLFAPQQTALNQQFQDQQTEANRLAARLGRSGNDPVLRNKLMQEQTRQQTMLNSQVGSYGMQLPAIRSQQVMDLGGALSNLRQGLATQALQNRQTLLALGNQLTNSERDYRVQTAQRYGNTYNTGETLSGGGLKGILGGAGAGMSSMMGMMGGGMGGGAKAPMAGASNLNTGGIA